MTTPAGWYDDGSGRQRWWDGEQWTEHFAPDLEAPHDAGTAESTTIDSSDAPDVAEAASAPSAAATETHDSIQSVAAAEAGATWDAPETTDEAGSTGEAGSTDAAAALGTPPSSEAAPSAESSSPDGDATAGSAEPTPAGFGPADAAHGTDPGEPTVHGDVPPYANAAPAPVAPGYPGVAPSYQGANPAYPGSAQNAAYPGSPYPGSAPGYGAPGYGTPGGYPAAAPAAPTRPSVLGLVGLGLAALGTLLACIPLSWIALIGWLMLIAGFITSVISLFLAGKKWPGITGLIVSIVGGIVAAILTIVFGIFATIATVSEEIRDLPTAPPSSESVPSPTTEPEDDTTDVQVEEGTIGDTVSLRFLGGSGEVTVTGATWSADDGSGVPSTNGGYLTVETTWTGIEGTTPANPFFTALETADGIEGELDLFSPGSPNELLESGQTASGPITFDVEQSDAYVFVVTDEAAREIARISVTPAAG